MGLYVIRTGEREVGWTELIPSTAPEPMRSFAQEAMRSKPRVLEKRCASQRQPAVA